MKRYEKIIEEINENGGFDNFNNWNYEEKIEWIISNFYCNRNTAKKVAIEL